MVYGTPTDSPFTVFGVDDSAWNVRSDGGIGGIVVNSSYGKYSICLYIYVYR